MKNLKLSLYVITDEELLIEKNIAQAVEQAILGGADIIQYRAKNKTSKQMYHEAIAIKKVCDKYRKPLVVNDRVDIALAIDADGVHVGQDDLDVEVVRRLIGFEKILGLSTKNIKQVEEANRLPVDYIGFGSIFPTSTKKDATLSGLKELKKAVELSIQPVVAIGGINEENIQQVLDTGCENVAVVSAVFGKKDIKNSTKKLKDIISKRKQMGFKP
ncbi:thiamine-phosphate diphosphorylase [Persephonella hydrogeniphila]|uniref:Thiamine-phosphate synthase n=1 Tax=Persephonella hydrogeniphila TaxID=198703 RepID=A0A285NG19_9AQUI|nr:thiamine phosphate synthase [Persephonella hydrogeniphila]SNZ08420.1 thiamine-phosphate diphosphorylase [Persephonella hydrogeniphila]